MRKYLSFSFLFFFLSCQNDDSNIHFRIKNNLGESISRCYLGARIRKGSNSYLTKSYAVKWRELEDGELTKYKKVKGKFWGYSTCNLEFHGENSKYPHQTHLSAIQESIDDLGLQLVEDSIQHPYSKKMVHKKRLPDGKYTLVIEGFHPKFSQAILVSVVKDE